MNYQEEYLKLKKKLLDFNQSGSGRLNPLFVQELTNLVFVVDDKILGEDTHSVILSLITEFNKLSSNNITHNLELGQFYAMEKGLIGEKGLVICENCELVLKYIDTTVCVSNGRLKQHIFKEDNKYYELSDFGKSVEIDCNLSRGLVRFYVKQKNGDNYTYTLIRILRMESANNLEPYLQALYQDNDEIAKLENATSLAISNGQSDAIVKNAVSGNLHINTPNEIDCSTAKINNIVTEVKNAAASGQMKKMNCSRILSTVPNTSSVTAANTVANKIMSTQAAKDNDLTVVLVPGNDPIPLNSNANIYTVQSTVTPSGIPKVNFNSKKEDTFNSKAINNRASLAIDGNLATIQTKNLINSDTVKITQPQNKSSATLANKLSGLTINFEEKINEAANNLKNIFNQNTQSRATQAPASIIPVSQNLSVMAPMATQVGGFSGFNDYGKLNYSIKETADLPHSLSQRNAVSRLNDKLIKNGYNQKISLDNSAKALPTMKNSLAYKAKMQMSSKNTNLSSHANSDTSSVLKMPLV